MCKGSSSRSANVLLVALVGLLMLGIRIPSTGLDEPTLATRYESLGSPFGIQDLTEARIGDYSEVLDAGVAWVRLEGLNGLNWALVEEHDGIYDWTRTDALAQELTQEGLQILWTVSSFHSSSGRLHFLPADMEGYLRFLRAAVERYDGDGEQDAPGSPVVSYFQIENEVDGHFWEDTAANYALLLRESLRVARATNPDAKIAIAGASTPEGYYRFYPEILAALSAGDEMFDVMDIHWYESVGDYSVHPKGNIQLVELLGDLRQAMPEVEFWFTEVGTHSGTDVAPSKPSQTEVQQATELVKRLVHFVGNGVARVFWHTLLESRAYTKLMEQNDFFDNTGLIYNGFTYINGEAVSRSEGVGEDLGDGVKKLGYYCYKLLAEKLADYEWVEPLHQEDGAYAYRFRVNGRDVWVAWREGGGTLSLPIPEASRVIMTEAVPDATSGSQLDDQDYPRFFNSVPVEVEEGVAQLILGDLPVLVETTSSGDI